MDERRLQEIINKYYNGDTDTYLRETQQNRQDVIRDSYGGDPARAEAAHNAARLGTFYWQNIADGATILPELEKEGHYLIARRMGYLTHDSIMLKHEPFLRVLIKNHRAGLLTDEAFAEQAEAQLIRLRNDDMALGGWTAKRQYTAAEYQHYETDFLPYKNMVRERVVKFLGYEPDLLYSLEAELWLRWFISDDLTPLHDGLDEPDVKTLTIIKYRQVLLNHGQAAADAFPLLGVRPAIVKRVPE